MKAEDFDRKFDDGEDVTRYLDLSTIRRPNLERGEDAGHRQAGQPTGLAPPAPDGAAACHRRHSTRSESTA